MYVDYVVNVCTYIQGILAHAGLLRTSPETSGMRNNIGAGTSYSFQECTIYARWTGKKIGVAEHL